MRSKAFCIVRNLLAIIFFIQPVASYAENLLSVTVDGVTETLSFDDLLAMPQTSVSTDNDYVNAVTEFSGPTLKDLLEKYNIDPKEMLILSAINDYYVNIPASDAFDFNVILALFRDGERMAIRDKGPIWVIYPLVKEMLINSDLYNGRMIWQLNSIVVE